MPITSEVDYMFVEVEFESGELIRARLPIDYWENYEKELGEWWAPYCNAPGCPAYGVIEVMAQDDDYSWILPSSIHSAIRRVKIYLP